MTGTITYILSRAGFRAMNGPLADERRRLAGAEPPAAYVSYDPRLLAGAGWYGYRIALKGGDRIMVERARYMLSERYTIRDGYEYYADGVYVFGVLLRERVPHYGIGGGAPAPEPDALNFYMPNGGTITLTKTGRPAVVELEYWLDENSRWLIWQPDNNGNRSITLNAGQSIYVRNTSETSTGFSQSNSDFYTFSFSTEAYAGGNIMSLLCNDTTNAVLRRSCFMKLFYYANIKTPPLLPSVSLTTGCYAYMFQHSNLEITPYLPATIVLQYAYYGMFSYSNNVNEIRTMMIDISESNCLYGWLSNVAATGDFYCPAELTIPTGASGIPSGWTRHDI